MSDPFEPHGSLLRHFADLRDRSHGGATTRRGKETAFERGVELLAPVVREVLITFDDHLLLGGGEIEDLAIRRDPQGGLVAGWILTWDQQRRSGVAAVQVIAHYGAGFHHPHLRGGTIAEWPLNVADGEQARGQRALVEAIVAAEFHNLVFLADYRIVPATVAVAAS